MATTNALVWNPTAANQENDAAYAADSQRAGGATNPAIFDATLANKLFYQLSTFMTGLFTAAANKGYTTSDSNLSTLIAQCANFIMTSDLATIESNISTLQTDVTNLEADKQDNLGFTPVQQGGGAGQGTNKVYIGWNGSQLLAQVDAANLGAILFASSVNPQIVTTVTDQTGSRFFGTAYQNLSGGEMAVSGNGFTGGGSVGTITCSIGPTSGLGTAFTTQYTATLNATGASFVIPKIPNGWYYAVFVTGTVGGTPEWIEAVTTVTV